MLICGIKVTHDAAVAVIDTDRRRLLFSVEMEKLDNGPRYAKMPDPATAIKRVLAEEGLDPLDIDVFALDGWKRGRISGHLLPAETYHEFDGFALALTDSTIRGHIPIGRGHYQYQSYKHMAGHVVGSYAASPFGRRDEPAYVLTWDGGQNPRVYLVDPRAEAPVAHVLGPTISEFYGIIYGIMGYYYGPYARLDVQLATDVVAEGPFYGGYETPGKLMSYIALGELHEDLLAAMQVTYDALVRDLSGDRMAFNQDGRLEHAFMRALRPAVQRMKVDAASVLLTMHTFLSRQLVRGVSALVPAGANLIFTGGSALNIKWNSDLRRSGHFADVWVPPFPNDCGSALGAAAVAAAKTCGLWNWDWSVYCGPRIHLGALRPGAGAPCTPRGLAQALAAAPDKPIVVLNERAEVGPRALGNRSILAAATLSENKAALNDMKRREPFRPVAPICLEDHARLVFSPGGADPYMLFDHQVRDHWRKVVPAIVHLDGSARLQTLRRDDNPTIHRVLSHYNDLTGVPLLCNTSANLNGCGFFPDVESALRWGGTESVWSGGRLYTRKDLP